MNEGCCRFRWKVTSSSPLTVTASRLRYQGLRGLTRSFSADLPAIKSQVHLTSLAVNGLPSCHLTPGRSLKVNSLASSLQAQLRARSGTIDSRLFCFTCWSNMTRLLKTPIIGPSTAIVDSSWIDMLAGLVIAGIRRMPPDFCASAGAAPKPASRATAAAAQDLTHRRIAFSSVAGSRGAAAICRARRLPCASR